LAARVYSHSMKVYVIRHGQTELNVQGIINGSLHDTLTLKGREQAKEAAATLPETIRRIYSSSLDRAKQTAEILNEARGALLTFHDELQEVNFGDLNGTPFLDEQKEKHMALDYDWRPSGECVEDVKVRVLRLLKEVADNHEDGEVLIVAHGGIVRLLHLLEHGERMGAIDNASLHTYDLDKILGRA